MKQKRTFIVLAIVVAVLALGIAYAVTLGNTLTITGSAEATASETNFKVEFTGTPTVTGDNSGSSSAEINAGDKTIATFDVKGLTTKGQKQTATFTMNNVNAADLKANVTVSDPVWDEDEYFKVTLDKKSLTIAPNETATISVIVECIKTPVDGTITEDLITVGINAVAEAANTPAQS